METFENLWNYCTANNRLCPAPALWSSLYGILSENKQKSSSGRRPPMPLILALWHDTMPIEKQQVLKEQIHWAADHNQLDEVGKFLRSLNEKQWVHFGEI